MKGAVGCLMLQAALAAPLTFEHLGSTWTIEAKNNQLEVTADCAENTWCGFGFNKDSPIMDGSDVFTFGYHQSADLVDCPTKNCGSGCGCGTGCGTRRLRSKPQPQNPYIPRWRDLAVQVPSPSAPGKPKSLAEVGGVVGIAMNSVLFVHEHPEEGMTWLFDNCGGHGDTYGHYHYHAPPLCLLRSLGVPVPVNSSWWKNEGVKAWPSHGPELQIGWALDGAPIMGPFKGGIRTEKKVLDECHGAIDEATGEYRYYLVPEAPFVPPCLRGAELGKVGSFRTSKEGQPCSKSDAKPVEISMVEGGRIIRGSGCPEHAMFKKVHQGLPFGFKKFKGSKVVRKLSSGNYGTCPAGAACGCGCGTSTCGCGCGTSTCGCGCGTSTCGCGCGTSTCGCGCGTSTCGCGCGTSTCGCGCGTSTCGCGCGTSNYGGCGGPSIKGCGTRSYGCGKGCGTRSYGCGCGTSTCGCGCGTSTCGCGCGTSTCGCGCGTSTCGCGCGTSTCGCGCGTTTCGCGCGTSTCGCGCGYTYECQGQMFCAKGLTKQGPVLSVPVSLSQCNGVGHDITIDDKQDLTGYSLTFENGRMKASGKRAFDTGDSTDYVLSTDTAYYILITVGTGHQVGYHGSSVTQTLVCEGTLTMKGECKLSSEWSGAPDLSRIQAAAAAAEDVNAAPMSRPFSVLMMAGPLVWLLG